VTVDGSEGAFTTICTVRFWCDLGDRLAGLGENGRSSVYSFGGVEGDRGETTGSSLCLEGIE
jgi:hypothetical protein